MPSFGDKFMKALNAPFEEIHPRTIAVKQRFLDSPFSDYFRRVYKNAARTDYVEAHGGHSGTATLAGGAALQKYEPLMFRIQPNGSLGDQLFFIVPGKMTLRKAFEIHATAGNDSGAVTMTVRRVRGGQPTSAGAVLFTSTFNMKSTANTQVEGTLVEDPSVLELEEDDLLFVDFGGTLTTLAGVTLTLWAYPGNVYPTAVYNVNANGSLADRAFFLALRRMRIVKIKYAHLTAGTNASAVNLQVTKDTSTNAPGAGTDLLTNNSNAGFNCKGTPRVVQEGALSATAANLILDAGDRLAVDFAGTLTALAGVIVVAVFEPIEGELIVNHFLQVAADMVDQTIFHAMRSYNVADFGVVQATAEVSAANLRVQLTRDSGTAAPGAGTNLLTDNSGNGVSLKATANTPQYGTLEAERLRYLLSGDRLAVDFEAAATELAGVVFAARLIYR